ncbi:MAG: hypothetical protein M3Q53_01250 [Actinomycetota bacterium]|nr:hypothetical protein [Actinomycetota bacterium]
MLSAVGIATVAIGLVVHEASGELGTPLPPFFAFWDPAVDPAALLWIPVLGLSLAGAIALLGARVGLGTFLLGTLVLALLARLAVAAAREGVDGWYAVFGIDPEAGNEYLPALPALESLGVRDFLDRFAELSPTLPIHPSAHPPGTLLLIDALGLDDARELAAVLIAAGTVAVPLTYALGRRVGLGEDAARAATMLLAFSPAAMLYGVVSTDAMYATLGLLAAVLLLGSGWGSRILGTAALAVASLFHWALLALGAFAALVTLLRAGLREAVAVSVLAGVVVLGFHGALHAATGFDPIGAIRAAGDAYDLGISNARPYIFWLLGSPVAFAVALGLPTAWYAARSLGAGNEAALALAAIIAVSVLIGLTKAETERIWLFMGPLAAVAAAALVPARRMPPVLALLAIQALATSLLLETIW